MDGAGQVRLPPDPGNASRFGSALLLASSGLAHAPARMAQKIVNQTSGHECRRFPVLRLLLFPPFAAHHSSLIIMTSPCLCFSLSV